MTDRREFLTGTMLGLVGLSLPEWVNAGTNFNRTLKVDKRYLNIPVKLGVPARHLSIRVRNELVRELSVELAPAKPDWWVFMDLTPFRGQAITMTLDELPGSSQNLNSLRQTDEILGHAFTYHEALRPQFHYSPKRGWMNDPNGLVYYEGEYHLFYQHYPYGTQLSLTGDWQAHWGHAVSKDLVHWNELPVALYPEQGFSIWSGSAVVDENDTAGFRTGAEKTLVALFTLADPKKLLTGKGHEFTQGMAYSNDRGRTWTQYAGNPVLPNVSVFNRDPKIIWYAPQKKWVMTLFLDRADYAGHPEPLGRDKSSFGFFSSTDLKHWERLSEVRIPGDEECPEFYEIAVDGDPKNTRWVIQGASGFYLVGAFDGITFTSESGPHRLHEGTGWHVHEGTGWYASQTFNHVPASDGRRILVPWAEADLYQGMPFNQSMGIPVELTLRTTAQGLRLYANPVRELTTLRVHSIVLKPQPLQPGTNPFAGLHGELLDVILAIDPERAEIITCDLRGVPVVYDVKARQVSCADAKAPLSLHNGRLRLRLLVDRTSIEIFGNEGQLYMSVAMVIPPTNTSLALTADNEAGIDALEVHTLRSIWT